MAGVRLCCEALLWRFPIEIHSSKPTDNENEQGGKWPATGYLQMLSASPEAASSRQLSIHCNAAETSWTHCIWCQHDSEHGG